MRCISRVNGNVFAASLVAFIITICFSGNWVVEEQACSYANEPTTCSDLQPNSGIAEKMYEKSDGKYILKLKSDVLRDTSSSSSSSPRRRYSSYTQPPSISASYTLPSSSSLLAGTDPVKLRNAVKDFYPAEAYEYQKCISPCSGSSCGMGMTALTHWGAPVINHYCIALGCGNKQCVKFTKKCNEEGGCEKSGDNCKEATMECTALPALYSEMSPIRFTCFFFGLLVSFLGCMCSCIIPTSPTGKVKPFEDTN